MPKPRTVPAGSDEASAAPRVSRGRNEARDTRESFGLACRDVIEEVRARMTRKGFEWE